MEAVIQTQNLAKKYGDLVAVDQLDLTVYRGEIFGLLSSNGAGKTTMILMFIGLTEPTLGQARVLGSDALREPLHVKRVVGWIFV